MIFVTGGTGLLGSHLISALLQAGQPVRALYRSSIPDFQHADRVEWIKGDILDMPLLEDAMYKVQQVYHCAAVVSFQPDQVDQLYKVNVEGTANVVNACLQANVEKLLYVSSVAALGTSEKNLPIDEDVQWTPNTNKSVYGKTKHLAEMEVWRGIGEGLRAVIVNPSIILGTSSNWNHGSSQIFKTVYNEFPWYTDGVTGFVDVLDVVKAMLMLMNSDITTERFILNADNIRYQDLFNMIADCFKKKKPNRKVTPLLAAAIWRMEAIRSFFTGSHPLLTKETATNAQKQIFFNNAKLLHTFSNFHYSPLPQSINRICADYERQLHIKEID